MKAKWSRLSGNRIHGSRRRAAFDFHAAIFQVLETEMLLRVVVEETGTERVVVTLYKTSRFRKYESDA